MNNQSPACPDAYGALIAARDPHPFCIVCMGLKHVQEAISFPEKCSHCLVLPKMLLHRRLKVAATQSIDLGLSDSDGEKVDTGVLLGASCGAASLSWVNQFDRSPFEDILLADSHFIDGPPSSRDEDNAGLLDGCSLTKSPQAVSPYSSPCSSLSSSIKALAHVLPKT